jgi:hypothetical protein
VRDIEKACVVDRQAGDNTGTAFLAAAAGTGTDERAQDDGHHKTHRHANLQQALAQPTTILIIAQDAARDAKRDNAQDAEDGTDGGTLGAAAARAARRVAVAEASHGMNRLAGGAPGEGLRQGGCGTLGPASNEGWLRRLSNIGRRRGALDINNVCGRLGARK